MYQVIIESGDADTQPYILPEQMIWDVAPSKLEQFIDLLMPTFNGEVTLTVKKLEGKE